MAERRLHFKQILRFSKVLIKKTEKRVRNSLSESIVKVKTGLDKKLKELRKQEQESQSSTSKVKGHLKRKVVYKNSS